MSKQTPPQDWDPTDADALNDPHSTYAELRGRCPVAYSDQWKGFWSLTRYHDITTAAADARTFINSVQNVVPHVGFGKRIPLHADPPAHTFYRRTLNPPFYPEHLAEFEPTIRQLVVTLLTPLLANGTCEFVRDFTYQLPVQVFCEFMNIPQEDGEQIKDHSERYSQALESGDYDTVKSESEALYGFAQKHVERRKSDSLDPETDVTSGLLAARMDGEPIPDEVIVGCIRQLMVAGHITLTLFLASAVWYLANQPDLQEQLRQQPEHIPHAIEELLRLYPPTQAFARTTTRDVEINGRTTIPEHDVVALLWIAGNRDEDVFPNPDQFDMHRERISAHLSFGHGVHKCLGAPLARMEARIVLEELLSRTSSFAVIGDAGPINAWPEYGLRHLQLQFHTEQST